MKKEINFFNKSQKQLITRFSENLLAIEMKKAKVKMNKPIYLGMSILDISKTLIVNFGMITLNQSMEIEQNYVIQILIALLLIL